MVAFKLSGIDVEVDADGFTGRKGDGDEGFGLRCSGSGMFSLLDGIFRLEGADEVCQYAKSIGVVQMADGES